MILLILKHLGSYIKISLRQAEWDSKYYQKKQFWVHISRIKQTTDKLLDEDMLFCVNNFYVIPGTVYYNVSIFITFLMTNLTVVVAVTSVA